MNARSSEGNIRGWIICPSDNVYIYIHMYSGDKTFLNGPSIGYFFFCFTDKRWLDPLVSFIRLSKGYYHCDHWSVSSHSLLKLPH